MNRFAIILVLFAISAGASQSWAQPSVAYTANTGYPHPWTILPLGDSITAGSDQWSCYRDALVMKLRKGGYPVNFVGSQERSGPDGVLRHEGYPGKPIEYLADNMERLYSANPADIILLHAGHNHDVEEHPIPGILEATKRIIMTARRINPHVIVFLAQVIPSGKLPKYEYIPELNRKLVVLAKELNTSDQSVILVDQASGFDPQTDTVADRVHPNAQGAEKMASQWYAALTPVLSSEHYLRRRRFDGRP